MNKQRRKELEKAVALLAEARELIEVCKDEEQDAFDNLPENFQESERGEQMEEYIYNMEEAIDAIEEVECNITDEVIEA